MLNKIATTITLFTFLSMPAAAEMMLFVGEDCEYCQALEFELTEQNLIESNQITLYEIYHNKTNAALYMAKSKELNYTNGGVPLLIDGDTFIEGRGPILSYLDGSVLPETTTLSVKDSEDLNVIIGNIDKKNNRNLGLFIIVMGVSLGFSVFGLSRFRKRKK